MNPVRDIWNQFAKPRAPTSARVELFESWGSAFARIMEYRGYTLLNTLIDMDSHKKVMELTAAPDLSESGIGAHGGAWHTLVAINLDQDSSVVFLAELIISLSSSFGRTNQLSRRFRRVGA